MFFCDVQVHFFFSSSSFVVLHVLPSVSRFSSFGRLVGWLVALAGWLVGRSVGWLRLVGRLAGGLVGRLVGWLGTTSAGPSSFSLGGEDAQQRLGGLAA